MLFRSNLAWWQNFCNRKEVVKIYLILGVSCNQNLKVFFWLGFAKFLHLVVKNRQACPNCDAFCRRFWLSLSFLMDDDLSPSRLHHKIDGKKNNLIAYILVAFLMFCRN
jgi:hypothetical protein